jgi:peptide/nickel transport system ATP-binding protein/oligopeptide transport system ATP-binding protein
VTDTAAPPTTAALEVTDLEVAYMVRGVPRAVLRGVSFRVAPGEAYGLVGESGCGKSTTGKMIMRLIEPTAGEIYLNGERIDALSRRAMRRRRSVLQVVFQDPYSSLNPRLRIRDIIAEPLKNYGVAQGSVLDERVETLAGKVGLRAEALNRYPHEFSGGQRQRIGIARALALNPGLIICDEPVSALDVSVRAQVINLLEDLKGQFGVSYLFISHDLSVVEHIADRVAVMYLGTLVEVAARDQIWRNPQHPYTKALLAAAPIADPKAARARQRNVLQGELPSPIDPPAGCPFHSRCPIAQDRCKFDRPMLRPVGDGVLAAYHFV